MIKKLIAIVLLNLVIINGFCDDDKFITVIAEGMGTSEETALKSAFSSAVRQAVGMYVSVDELIKNEEVVKNDILTYSDGIVSDYTVLKKSKNYDGLYTVSIKAVVERRKLLSKLGKSNITIVSISTKGIYSKIISEDMAKKDGVALFKKEMEGYPWDIIEIDEIGGPQVIKKGHGNHTIMFPYNISVNYKKYRQFTKRLEIILDMITSMNVERVSTQQKVTQYCTEEIIQGLLKSGNILQQFKPPSIRTPVYLPYLAIKQKPQMSDKLANLRNKGYNFFLAERIFHDGTSIQWKAYKIDPKSLSYCYKLVERSFILSTIFIDSDGDKILIRNNETGQGFRCKNPLNIISTLDEYGKRNNRQLNFKKHPISIAPLIVASQTFNIKMVALFRYTLSNDILRNTEKIKLELKFEPMK